MSSSAPSRAVESIDVELPGARVAFSTRHGGVSEGPYASLNLGILTDDQPERALENRRRLAASAGLEPERVAMGWQVHGSEVLEWAAPPEASAYASPGTERPRVDGHTTTLAGIGLLVLAADCLPIALASPDRVAMVHGGWRGLAGGVIERALERFAGEPVAAAVGPGIGPCCYEVGPEVLEAFADLPGVASGRRLDLKAVARRRLASGGVRRVEDVELCTSCRPDLFFSHRRDRGVTGRQGGLVWRAG
jgi:YfiH family protein